MQLTGKGPDMILSGYLSADSVDRTSASGRLSARLSDIDARRRSAEHAVDALVQAWRENPVVQQQDRWRAVDDAAHEVVDALSSLLGEIDLAREEMAVNPPSPRSGS